MREEGAASKLQRKRNDRGIARSEAAKRRREEGRAPLRTIDHLRNALEAIKKDHALIEKVRMKLLLAVENLDGGQKQIEDGEVEVGKLNQGTGRRLTREALAILEEARAEA